MSQNLRKLIGKRIVGVIMDKMSSNNRTVTTHEGLVLEDARGRRSFLRWTTIEETDGDYYGTTLSYPGCAPRNSDSIKWFGAQGIALRPPHG